MKLVISSVAVFATTTLANLQQLFGLTDEYARSTLSNKLDSVSNYGCWCSFNIDGDNEIMTQGRGAPLDTVDEGCKALYERYQCAEMEIIDKNMTCDVYKQEYISTKNDDTHIACEANLLLPQYGDCGYLACMTEYPFSKSLDFFELSADNTDLKSKGEFDIKCPGKQCNGPACNAPVECCGTGENRKLFKTLTPNGESRVCCGGKTFVDSGILECCNDQIVPAGTLTC